VLQVGKKLLFDCRQMPGPDLLFLNHYRHPYRKKNKKVMQQKKVQDNPEINACSWFWFLGEKCWFSLKATH